MRKLHEIVVDDAAYQRFMPHHAKRGAITKRHPRREARLDQFYNNIVRAEQNLPDKIQNIPPRSNMRSVRLSVKSCASDSVMATEAVVPSPFTVCH